jgi:hypothetical protein
MRATRATRGSLAGRRFARSSMVVLLVTALAPLGAAAQSAERDWIDAFPSVTEVAEAAFEELEVTAVRNPSVDMTRDDDSIAVNLAATYVMLRQILLLKRGTERVISPARTAKLNRLVAAYQEAELTIGRGAAGRRGYITARPPLGLDCRDIACYQRWFELHLNANSGRAEYRRRLLRRLFPCGGLAAELDDLRQRSATRMPFTPSPSVTMNVERSVAGLAPAGCAAYGGDANRNGLCDDWEAGFSRARTRGPGAPEACGTLTLVKATTSDARGIDVEYTVDADWQPQDLRFLVYRSARRQLDGSKPLAETTLAIPARSGTAPRALRVVDDVELAPDTNKPYVIVVARQRRHESTVWFQKHLVGVLVHGYTFRKWFEAANFVSADVGAVMAGWLFGGEDVEPWQRTLESRLERSCYSPATFAFNWRHTSVEELGSLLTQKARDELYPRIAATAAELVRRHQGDVVDFHFIGHSRGAVMVSQALLAWSRSGDSAPLRGSYVIVTLLDPHPANNEVPIQEDYASSNPLAAAAYLQYKYFQDKVKDPAIVLPAGAGIREVQVIYQQNTVAEILADPPQIDGLWDRTVDLAAAFFLWGQGGGIDYITRNNRSGVPIRWQRLRKFADGGTVTHSGVVHYFSARYSTFDPLLQMSPERGNCLPIYRFN